MNKKSGFTLAEVLVTLMIIGVIAAMTIPSLMQSTAKQEYIAALKKSVSAINQALALNYALEGTGAADDVTLSFLTRRMNVVDTAQQISGSAPTDGQVMNGFATSDGIQYVLVGNTLYVDVNGQKKPNKLTTDSSNPQDRYSLTLDTSRNIVKATGKAGEVLYKFNDGGSN